MLRPSGDFCYAFCDEQKIRREAHDRCRQQTFYNVSLLLIINIYTTQYCRRSAPTQKKICESFFFLLFGKKHTGHPFKIYCLFVLLRGCTDKERCNLLGMENDVSHPSPSLSLSLSPLSLPALYLASLPLSFPLQPISVAA